MLSRVGLFEPDRGDDHGCDVGVRRHGERRTRVGPGEHV